MADLHPIDILIEELQDEDVQNRLNSVKRLSTISLALGEERTRTELLPFLTDQLEDEDEVRLEVAAELAKFVPLVGGQKYAHTLIAPLEALARIDEIVVRNKAVESLNTIVKEMAPADIEAHFLPAVTRLATGDFFASRSSACGLFAEAYAKASAGARAELLKSFAALCQDDTPMVRRAAASGLKDLVVAAGTGSAAQVTESLLPLYNQLVTDDQDSVRLLAVSAASALMSALKGTEGAATVVASLNAASKDRSWKVRNATAEAFSEAQAAVSPDVMKAELVPVLVRLLRDQEAEVRTHAVF
jgi:serine/threonine-protein phosphatase 2A regulatory subunit A